MLKFISISSATMKIKQRTCIYQSLCSQHSSHWISCFLLHKKKESDGWNRKSFLKLPGKGNCSRAFFYYKIKGGNKYSLCSSVLWSCCEKCFTHLVKHISFQAKVIYAINSSKSYIHQVVKRSCLVENICQASWVYFCGLTVKPSLLRCFLFPITHLGILTSIANNEFDKPTFLSHKISDELKFREMENVFMTFERSMSYVKVCKCKIQAEVKFKMK